MRIPILTGGSNCAHTRLRGSFCLLLVAAVCRFALGAEPSRELTNSVRQLDANTFQIGAVRLDTKQRKLVIPATVNMVEGQIEYVLVSAIGKLHESIFKTTAEPIHVQTAALLLAKAPSNAPIRVQVTVELDGGKSLSADELIEDITTSKSLPAGLWRYNGSRVVDGTFIAQRDGSIVSIIADPDAIVETGRISAENDENWRPRKASLPPVGAPVKITLSFPPEEKSPTQ